ncbi:carbonic anhydrase-related protein 10-like [Pocillopora damicornis]|uniref:carbonic anhydrase-related protein 10-like n=1 Tax=Pocillopora damicornis TaxID=46731 RepID=UPI000F55399F|nr:carbonic anhydrase-related protein 10-like [Pocillopora damicornis]
MGTKCEELQDDEFFSYGETTSEAPGPSDWYKKWEQCDGRRQSPINIVTTRVRRRHFRTLKIEFDRLGGLVTGELKNNGNAPTFFVDEDKGTAKLKGNHLKGTYKLDQFHVHFGCKNNRGSEHTLNGHRFAAEIHFVFVNSKGRIAVVAVWLRASKYENTILGRLANQMHKIIDVGMLLLLLLLSAVGVAVSEQCEADLQDGEDFSYGDTTSQAPGPSDWYIKWERCGGNRQSPINIDTTRVRERKYRTLKIEFDNSGGLVAGDLENNGNYPTFSVDKSKGTARLKGSRLTDTYVLKGFHVHFGCENDRGSEHTRNGRRYSGEVHFLFEDPSGRYVVVAFWLRHSTTKENVILGRFANQLEKIKEVDQSTEIKKAIGITLMDLIPHKSRQRKTLILADYYYYKGSLTTPPCCENVSWFILKPRVPITDYELSQFRTLEGRYPKDPPAMCDNYRPLQPRNGRRVYSVTNLK